MKQVKDVKGLDWGVGAIGNAEWTGTQHLLICSGGTQVNGGLGEDRCRTAGYPQLCRTFK